MYDRIKKITDDLETSNFCTIDNETFLALETSIEKYSSSIVTMLMDKDLSKEDIIKEIEQDNFYELADILAKVQEISYELENVADELEPTIKELRQIESDLLWEELK